MSYRIIVMKSLKLVMQLYIKLVEMNDTYILICYEV